MTRHRLVKHFFPLFALILVFALTACVRTLPRDENQTDTTVTTEPLVMPTAVPLDTPVPEATTIIDTNTDTGNGTTTEGQPAESPTATPESSDTTTTEPEANPDTYTVQAGDTLGQIAEQFNLTLEELAAANGITNIDTLDVGQVLNIPEAGTVDTSDTSTEETPPATSTEEQTHVVKAGENLFRIGLAYGVTVDDLAAYNGITDPNQLEVGQVIKIPPSP